MMALIDGLISYYKLDEASGSIIDAHGSNDGTYTGALYSQSGKIGTSIGFDGTNDNIDLNFGSGTTLYSGFSVSFWAKPTDYTSDKYGAIWASATSDHRFYIGNYSSKWDFSIATHGIGEGTGQATASNEWTHIVAVINGASAILYVNGVSTVTWSDIDSGFTLAQDIFIGSTTGLWDGLIDEVGIWNKSLTSDEVTLLRNGGDGLAYPFTEDPVPIKIFDVRFG